MMPFLGLLFLLNIALAIYMAYRLIKSEEKNAVYLPLVGAFVAIALLSFQEFQILYIKDKILIDYFARTHTVNSILILLMAMISSIAFLYPLKKSKALHKTLNILLLIPTLLLLFDIGIQKDLSYLTLSNNQDVWKYKLNINSFTGILYTGYIFFACLLIMHSYWSVYYRKHGLIKDYKNIAPLIFQSIIIIGSCIAFVYLPQSQYMVFAASIPFSICGIALVWIFTHFNLAKINSSLALNDILNSMSNILIITNKNFKIVEINNEGVKKLKVSRKDIEGLTILELVRLLKIDDWKSVAQALRLKQKITGVEQLLKMQINDVFHFININVKAHYNSHNKITGYVFIGTDVTETHEQSLAIKEYNENLERTNKELERFAYIASHDLKTPLRSVVSFLDLIERRIVKYSDKELKEFVYLARQGASQMHHLIKDILEFSRFENTSEVKTTIDLNETVFNICHTLQPTIREKQGELLVSNLPMLKAEKTHMTQLFTNLIENGFKYNEHNRPVVKVNHRQENSHHLFAITDNGIGVEQQYYDQIFEMFKRLHTNPNHEGSGIGLSICKKIVDMYKGEIWLESNVNEGTTFFFTLEAN